MSASLGTIHLRGIFVILKGILEVFTRLCASLGGSIKQISSNSSVAGFSDSIEGFPHNLLIPGGFISLTIVPLWRH